MLPLLKKLTDGALRGFTHALVRFYYPRIEIRGTERIPKNGPVLLAANHPNSLIDPALLGIAAGRPVRLMAKAPLFDIPVFGALMHALGMVPAYRGSDDKRQVARNLESLAKAAQSVADGNALGIFPEGKSHDDEQLAMVRSGAARLAMQALAAGAKGLKLVPVGLNYERKERFRSVVWIEIGEPVDVEEWLAAHEGDEHKAMRALTPEIARRLQACIIHLDNTEQAPVLDVVTDLFQAARRGDALKALHLRKHVADELNRRLKSDPVTVTTLLPELLAHGAACRRAGLRNGAGGLLQSRFVRTAWSVWDGLRLVPLTLFGVLGLIHHVLPYGMVRLLAGRFSTAGRMTVALNRLLFSVPIYAVWYAGVWYLQKQYFLQWVWWTWLGAMPFAGLVALGCARNWREAPMRWLAGVKLWFSPDRERDLREEHLRLREALLKLDTKADAVSAVRSKEVSVSHRVLRPTVWLAVLMSMTGIAVLLWGGWLLRDRAFAEWGEEGPDLHAMTQPVLSARLDEDERGMIAVMESLKALEAKFTVFESQIVSGERSYYLPDDEDEIRRMLCSYLSLRTALLRTAWQYQDFRDISDGRTALRARLLHYTAAALAYDYTARFVQAFENRPVAQRKINEAEPLWDLPEGTYDRLRAGLANVGHRRWLEAGWRAYHENLSRWEEAGLGPDAAGPSSVFHAAIREAAEHTASLDKSLVKFKIATAWSDVKNLSGGGYYKASAAISTLIGDTKLRAPRNGKPLVSEEMLERLRPMLRPGDLLIERRNWYLSNAFLPGYWPHSALYVGTAEDLRKLGVTDDKRVQAHLADFAGNDAAGHPFAVIEAMSEGVVFTAIEHSIGEADSVAVLRPQLSDDERREMIARAFSHAGKPYDFDFDFFSSDKLVCTEVLYRSLAGTIDFPLVEILGRKTLPAGEIVRYWMSDDGAKKLKFVAMLDGDEASGECRWADAETLRQSVDRPALTWLQ